MLLPAWAALALTLPAYEPRFTVDAKNHVTAVYHLACLTDQIGCTKPKFEAQADHPAVREWKAAFAALRFAAEDTTPMPFPANTRGMHARVRRQAQVLEAVLDSKSSRELGRRARIEASLAHKIWEAAASMRKSLGDSPAAMRRHLPPARRALTDRRLIGLARDVGSLLAPREASEAVALHIIPSPEPKTDEASGTFIGRHAVLEVTDSFKPDFMASVALHEIIHYLYDSVPAAVQRERMSLFTASRHPRAASFYALFNEALAVATQHLLASRLGQPRLSDEDMYDHPWIPRAGRVLAPVLETWISQRGRFDAAFVSAYEKACVQEFSAQLAQPRFALASGAFVVPGDAAGKAFMILMSKLQPVSWMKTASDDWQQYSHLPVVMLGTREQLKRLYPAQPELERLADRRSFVFEYRDGDRNVFVLGGRDSEGVAEAARELLARP